MGIIRSKANSLVKETRKLQQKKHRKKSYLIEGWHLLEEAQKAGATIERIFLAESQQDRLPVTPNLVLVSDEVLASLADSQTPQGVVAQLALPVQGLQLKPKGKYLVLEDVQDPGNVGTMIRTADAAGYDAVFLTDKSADLYSMKVLRSMQGSHFHLPIYRLPIEDLLTILRSAGVEILATTLSSDSQDYREISHSESFALVMGNEGRGISDFLAQEADQLVHITMPGRAESLNVAVATGILLFSFI